jgi:hypothetical protein
MALFRPGCVSLLDLLVRRSAVYAPRGYYASAQSLDSLARTKNGHFSSGIKEKLLVIIIRKC